MINDTLGFFLGAALSAVMLLALLNRLALLQERDYLLARMLSSRGSLIPRLFELPLVLAGIFLLISQFSGEPVASVLIALAIAASIPALLIQLKALATRRFKKPKLTFRLMINTAVIFELWVVMVVMLLIAKTNPEVAVGLSCIVFTLLATFWVILSNGLTRRFIFIGHRLQMRKASAQIAAIKDLNVIGITGSYGKSTTKLFLNTLLARRFKFISTPGSINTDIGLAKSINGQLAQMSAPEVSAISQAVLEMDAYVVETLPRVTRFFPLDIAILTSVNEQHLETFGGDINNSIKANYNIFTGLKPAGKKLAVINADDKNCRIIMDMLRRQKPEVEIYTYGSLASDGAPEVKAVATADSPTDTTAPEIDVLVSAVRSEHKLEGIGIAFQIKLSARLGGDKLSIYLPVPGKFNAQNFAAASLAAILSGLPSDEIVPAATEVTLRDRNLQLRRVGQSGSSVSSSIEIIDDSFSANPAGLWANLQLLAERNQAFPAKSIFITPGLEDLAGESVRIHSEIAAQATQVADYVILTTSHGRDINLPKIPTNLHLFESPTQVIEKLREVLALHKQENLRIFISGRVAAAIYNFINSYGI